METNTQPKEAFANVTRAKWLAWASSFALIVIATYITLHAYLPGEERTFLNKEQLSAVNSIISTGTAVSTDATTSIKDSIPEVVQARIDSLNAISEKEVKVLIENYLKDVLDINCKDDIHRLVDTYDLKHLPVVLPTYSFRVRSFFWLSGTRLLMEVIFWALFGLIANLMYSVTTAEVFDPKRIPEHIGKIFYSPFSTVVIYLSLNALVNAGSISLDGVGKHVVVLSFILGFFTRRTIVLLNKVKSIMLPASDKEIKELSGGTQQQESSPANSGTESTNDTDMEAIAKQAVEQNADDLNTTFPGLIQTLEEGVTKNNVIGVIAHVTKTPPADFPKTLSVTINGQKKTVELEAVVAEEGEAHIGLNYRLENEDESNMTGAVGAILQSTKKKSDRFILTCSHVAMGGRKDNLKGFNSKGIVVDILDGKKKKAEGILKYARLDQQVDVGLILLDKDGEDFNNELDTGEVFKEAIAMDTLKLNQPIRFYSSLEETEVEGSIQKISSKQEVFLRYTNGIQKFTNLIILGSKGAGRRTGISQKGDSGAVVYTEDLEPFAMIIGGTSKFTYAIPIDPILKETQTKIYTK